MTCPECGGRGKMSTHFCDYSCVSRGWCLPEELVEIDCGYCDGTGTYPRKERQDADAT